MHANITNKLLKAILAADDGHKLAAYRALTEKERAAKSAETPILLNMTQAARALCVSRTTLWEMVRDGRITCVEVIPGLRRIRRADLEKYVRGTRV
jgi:excisionase family DNA binding protein